MINVKFNGIATSANDVYARDIIGLKQLPTVDVREVDIPGGYPQDTSLRLLPIEFEIVFGIQPSVKTHTGYVTACDKLMEIIYPDLNDTNRGFKKFEYDDATGKYIMVRPNTGFKIEELWPVKQRIVNLVTVPFRALTPFWISSTATTGSINFGIANGTTINDGNLTVYPTYTLTFNTTVTSCSVQVSGNTITINETLGTANTIIINTEKQEIKKDGVLLAAGKWSGTWPIIPVGTSTISKPSYPANVKITYTYEKRYRS